MLTSKGKEKIKLGKCFWNSSSLALTGKRQCPLRPNSSISWYHVSHSPWYRTVLRGTGFQLRPSDFSHPTRNTRSKTLVPPMAPVSAPIRWSWRWVMDVGINQLMRGARESSSAPGCLPRERKTNTSAGSSNSLLLLGLGCLSETIFVTTVSTTCTFFKKATQNDSLVQAAAEDKSPSLKTCSV